MKPAALLFFLIFSSICANLSLASDKKAEAENLLMKAETVLHNFMTDPNMASFRRQYKSAKGILIIPKYIKGGFVVGGTGGKGVLLRHKPQSGENAWSYPAFYTMGSITFGLQVGGELAEVILLFKQAKALDALLSSNMQLGADASVAAGPVGQGVQVATADILLYSRAKGLFGGLTLEGAVVSVKESYNQAYYGQYYSPLDILIYNKAINHQADGLLAKLTQYSLH